MVDNLENFQEVRAKAVGEAIKRGTAYDISKKGKLLVNFPKAISQFENAMHRFPVKKVLYKSVFRGKGLEFESYREYAPDDDANLIDWKASLRANELLAKQYVEERELNIYFLIDVSNSMLFGSSDKLKAEYAAEFIASLSHLITNSGDRVGLVMFADNVVKVLHPSASKNQFALITKFLSDSNFYGGGFGVTNAIDYVLKTVKSSYTVFILVSDFIRMKKNDLKSLRMMGSKFETFAVMIRDEMDEDLSNINFQFSIQDPYSRRQMILDPSLVAESYKNSVAKQKALIKEMMKRSRIDFLELKTNRGFIIPLSGFLKARAVGARI